MKKVLFVLLTLLVVSSMTSYAQGFRNGSKTLNAGIGIGFAGIEGSATLPPISIGYQVGITNKISVGGIVCYSGSSYKAAFGASSYEWKYSYIVIGARGEYHFMEPSDKLDLYAGLTLGYDIVSVTTPSGTLTGISYSAAGSGLFVGGHVGARYAVSNSWGGFAELGYGIGYLTVGAYFKL
jgi:hypothetical protein